MKTIKITIALIIFPILTYAQTTKVAQANSDDIKQIKIPELDKFIGTWEFKDAGQILTVRLRKVPFSTPNGMISTELITGDYTYLNNGKVIDKPIEGKNTISAGHLDLENKDLLSFNYRNSNSTVYGLGLLEFKKGSPNTILWKIRNPKGRGFPAPKVVFNIPTAITLEKIN